MTPPIHYRSALNMPRWAALALRGYCEKQVPALCGMRKRKNRKLAKTRTVQTLARYARCRKTLRKSFILHLQKKVHLKQQDTKDEAARDQRRNSSS